MRASNLFALPLNDANDAAISFPYTQLKYIFASNLVMGIYENRFYFVNTVRPSFVCNSHKKRLGIKEKLRLLTFAKHKFSIASKNIR